MSCVKLNIKDGKAVDEKEKSVYQRLVGKLIYLTLTRSDITYAVNLVSQFMHAPSDTYMQTTERILSYLKKNLGKGSLFTRSNDMRIDGYYDADSARSVDTQRSTIGYCVFLGGNLVIWRSKRQIVCSRSSVEAEYRAVVMGVIELLWLKILLRNIGLKAEDTM